MVAGEGAARGITQMSVTDVVRNLWNKINTIIDDVMTKAPYFGGHVVGVCDSNGIYTVSHGLNFTPSSVFVVARYGVASGYCIFTTVSGITSTTFNTEWFAPVSAGGNNRYFALANNKTVSFDWFAYR